MSTTTKPVVQPIDFRQGIDLLGRMSLIEFAIESSLSGDDGPLTSTPSSRGSMAIVLRDLARTFDEISNAIDPLSAEADVRWQPVTAESETEN